MSLALGGTALPLSYGVDLACWIDSTFNYGQLQDRSLAAPLPFTSSGTTFPGATFKRGTAPAITVGTSGAISTVNSITHGTDATWIVVLHNSGGIAHTRLIVGTTGTKTRMSIGGAGSKVILKDDGTGTLTGTADLSGTTTAIIAGVISGTNGTIYINGTQDATTTGYTLTGAVDGNGVFIGDGTVATNAHDFAEIVIIKRALNASEILNMTRYCQNRWI